MSRLRVHWTTQENDLVGNALGYNTHNRFMRKYCQPLMDFDDAAPVALSINSADKFVPVPGKFNVLFTMWEFLDLPQSYIVGINKADALVVPSSFCRDLFRRYTDIPIYVCWEGIEPGAFTHHERAFPPKGQRFRFLWIGAPNPRKGYPLINEVCKVIENDPGIEMYIKTTVPRINVLQSIKNVLRYRKDILKVSAGRGAFWRMLKSIPRPGLADKVRTLGRHKNIIFDTRKLPLADLTALYNSAHCFLLPTFGEGWGLTLCEAMATGCPSIATAITGCADFFNEEVGYPIAYHIREQELLNYDLVTRGYVPDTNDMLKQMIRVYQNYAEALKRGRRAAALMRNKFTWEHSGQRMEYILGEIYSKHLARRAA